MTKKDYELIASTLHSSMYVANTYPSLIESQAAGEQYRRSVNALSNALALENERFDRTKFLTACGIEQQTVGGFVADTIYDV